MREMRDRHGATAFIVHPAVYGEILAELRLLEAAPLDPRLGFRSVLCVHGVLCHVDRNVDRRGRW